jgi:hypothetical protein
MPSSPEEKTMGYYYHDVPGRLRIKSPFLKRNPGLARELQAELSQIWGVGEVTVSTVTGSVVVWYEPKTIHPEAILGRLERRGCFDASKAVTNDQRIHAAATRTGGILWSAVAGTLIEQAFQGSALSFLAILI